MLILCEQEHRIGSTTVEIRPVACDPETIHRMVPGDNLKTVKATFTDGQEMTLVGDIEELVGRVNAMLHPPVYSVASTLEEARCKREG